MIHYHGPDGTAYNLTSGSSCVDLFVAGAMQMAGVSESAFQEAEVPPGIVAEPVAARRIGNLIWLEFDKPEHGDHANKFAQPMMQYYGVPWLNGEGGATLSPVFNSLKWLIGPAIVAGAAYAAWRHVRG